MITATRSSLAALAALTLLAGCEWQVETESATQGLAVEEQGETCPDVTDLPGEPQCGLQFVAGLRGECNDCSDRGCKVSNEGAAHDCVCHEEGERCFAQPMIVLPDGGIQPSEFCAYEGKSCDCNDGMGAIYSCECEGGGDDCHCRVPSDPDILFDYDHLCEN